jgi:hypothetical protein
MERKRAGETHSLPGEHIGMDKSGHGKERKRARERYSLAGERIGMDKSGHGKEESERAALTRW